MSYSGTIISEQYPATDETQCINLIIPAGDEFKALAYGLLNKATFPLSYDEPDSAQTEGLCAVWSDALYQTDWEGCTVETGRQNAITLLHRFGIVVTGNPMAWVSNTAMSYGGFLRQNTPALNDLVRFYVDLSPGDYRLSILHSKSQNSGKIDIRMNNGMAGGSNVVIATGVDFYNASEIYNQVYEVDFTVPEGENWSLDYLTSGKNASSGNYFVQITASYIRRV